MMYCSAVAVQKSVMVYPVTFDGKHGFTYRITRNPSKAQEKFGPYVTVFNVFRAV